MRQSTIKTEFYVPDVQAFLVHIRGVLDELIIIIIIIIMFNTSIALFAVTYDQKRFTNFKDPL